MRILVTAGNTQVPIDRVRCITNVFRGGTGARIALAAQGRGHRVTLLTSNPEMIAELGDEARLDERLVVARYRTFDNLQTMMAELVRPGGLDVIIHSAAVSDYRVAGTYAAAPNTHFRVADGRWETTDASPPTLEDHGAEKVKSDESELWLRLVRTPKLVDLVRADWEFHGVLVMFKLEVGVNDESLLLTAERSRRRSGADLIVANTLEGVTYVGPTAGVYNRVSRRELPDRLLDAVQSLDKERNHG